MNFEDAVQLLVPQVGKKIVPAASGCWMWTGCVNNTYGRVGIKRKRVYVHRYVYETLVGPVARDLEIDHLCRVRLCCNPDHLEPVPPIVNFIRGENPGVGILLTGRCVEGHEVSGANAYEIGNRLECRTCSIAKVRRYQERKRLAAVAARAAAAAAGEAYIADIGKHGETGYKLHGCRCDACRAAAKASLDRYRKKSPRRRDAAIGGAA